jgi:hypothetical protein
MGGIVAGLLLSGASTGAAARDLVGIRSLGMGTALRASATGSSGPLLNPAGMSLARMYVLGTQYQFRGSDSGHLVHVSVVDSITARLAAGLYYSFVHAEPEQLLATADGPLALAQTLTTHEVGLALSYPLGQFLNLGLTTKYVNHQGELTETAPESVGAAEVSRLTLDAGAVLHHSSGLRLGVVGNNLVAVDDPDFARSLGLGLALARSVLLVEVDTVIDFSSNPDETEVGVHGGFELFLAQRFAIRGGASHDTFREATYVTVGGGLVSRKVALHFGLRQMVDGGAETLFGFSLQLFMQ